MRSTSKLVCGVVMTSALLGATSSAHAGAIVLNSFNGSTLAGNDDGSTGLVGIGFDINFFGVNYSNLFVNNNGNVTFNAALPTFTPFSLLSTSVPMLAPYFGDVDTRPAAGNPPAGEEVTYGGGTFDSRQAFGVNWVDVGYFANRTTYLNSFQLVMVDRGDTGAGNFDFLFNYDRILWETGEASGGSALGCGGSSARVGYSNGVNTAFELQGSAVNGAFVDEASVCNGAAGAFALTLGSRNSDIDGRYLFEVRDGFVTGNMIPNPEPATLVMLGTGLLFIGGMARRQYRRRQ